MKDDKPNFPRTLISMLAFITVAVFICLWLSINVFADETIDILEHYSIDTVLNSDEFSDFNNPVFVTTGGTYNSWVSFLSSYTSSPTYNVVDNFSINQSDYYCWTNQSFFACFDDESFITVQDNENGSRLYLHLPDDFISSSFSFRYLDSGLSTVRTNAWGSADLKVLDGKYYMLWGNNSDYFDIINSNLPIIQVTNNNTVLTSVPDFNDNINPNYNTGLSDSDKALQHMNFDNAQVFINVNKNFDGNVISCLSMDDYQFDNSSLYTLKASINCDVKYHHDVTNSSITGSFAGSFNRPLSVYTQNGNIGYYSIDFNEFMSYASGSVYNDNNLVYSNFSMNSFIPEQLPDDSTKETQSKITFGYQDYTLTLPIAFNINHIVYDTFNIDIVYTIYKDNLECGSFRCYYDVLQGNQNSNSSFRKNKTTLSDVSNYNSDNNFTDGDSGYLNPSNYVNKYGVGTNNNGIGSSNNPIVNTSGGTSSSSPSVNVSANGGSITVNTGQDPSAVVDYVKNELIYDNESTFVTQLDDFTEGNSFITLMSSTFSFLPAAFWNNVGIYFTICLGILVSFFVLRLILDLL